MVWLVVLVMMMVIINDVFLFRSAVVRWSLRWSGAQEEKAAWTNSDQEDVHDQYGDKKDEEDPELEIEIFLKSDFKMISICKILDFMFLD